MPTLETAAIAPVTKLLLIGDSGSGKTGSIASLVKAGYRIRILDLDNKIAGGILPQVIRKESPGHLKDVEYIPLRDQMRATEAGTVLDGAPTAFVGAIRLLDKWTDGSGPKTWGPQFVLVLDSLTFFADAAFNWAKSMNPSAKDPRQWYGSAQRAVENSLHQLTSTTFNTNVIVISHVSWITRSDGTTKGYPASVGTALNPTIPAYFENMVLCQATAGGKRTIQTVATSLLDLKNPASFTMKPTLPIETGLADFFRTLRQ